MKQKYDALLDQFNQGITREQGLIEQLLEELYKTNDVHGLISLYAAVHTCFSRINPGKKIKR